MKAHGSAVQADLAGGGARNTGERLHQLGASGAHQADVIKLQDFMLGKRGGRLIEDHHLGVESQRPGNRHHVTLGDAEGFQRGSRVDLDFQPGEDLVGSAVHRRPVERF